MRDAEAPTLAPPPTPLLVDAAEAARLCGVARSSWWRLVSSGRTPTPVRLGRRTLWRAAELAAWCAAGCPGRDRWQALQAAQKGTRP